MHPEKNREVKVIEFQDAEIDGILHNGFEILMEGDLRDLVLDKYKAQLVTENEILITMPSGSHYLLHEHDNYFKQVKAFKVLCPRTKEAYNAARNPILSDVKRLTKHILLRFSEEITLSNDQYSPKATNYELEYEMVPYVSSFEILGKQFTTTVGTIFWKIAVFEEKRRVVKAKDDKAKKGEAKLAQCFASMSF